jgi:hypothetical protein
MIYENENWLVKNISDTILRKAERTENVRKSRRAGSSGCNIILNKI